MSGNANENLERSLRTVLSQAQPPYTELTMRLLFCTTLHASATSYRIRELEIYSVDDPYTHQGDEQVSTCGGWYFHRTKPGGGWKGGTFMGMDISFAPVGTAGGILIRGMSRCGDGKYFDGPCNCVRELLRACEVAKIKELVEKPEFQLDALTADGIMRLVEHDPIPIPLSKNSSKGRMEWKATSRVGLSEPSKRPEQEKERRAFHLAPLRFLPAPYETKKEKTKVTGAKTGGIFTIDQYHKLGQKSETAGEKWTQVTKVKKKTMTDLFGSDSDGFSDSDHDNGQKNIKQNMAKKKSPFSDSDESDDDEQTNTKRKRLKKITIHLKAKKSGTIGDSNNDQGHSNTKKESAVWHYWLAHGMDGKKRGWHFYDRAACAKLEGFTQSKGEQLSRTTWHLKSGFFSYEVNISNMTQRNMKSGTIRPIRRVLAGETYSMVEPPSSTFPKNTVKKHKASWSPPASNLTTGSKKAKLEEPAAGLKLEPLFSGQHGYAWEGVLTQVLESLLPKSADFIGPDRNKEILPVREMTFRALMALPPEQNNLIVFGQAPYPRVESSSGIAMFDSLIESWDCSQFGKTVSMRCITKTAAVAKGIVPQDANISDIRKAITSHNIVSPPEWFQAMLAQGVLLLNASLTNGVFSTAQHTKFWMPVMQCIVEEILRSKRDKFPPGAPKRRIGFLWWGKEALKTKKALAVVLAKYKNEVDITHIEHFNPAAQGDKFSKPPNHFEAVNAALAKGNLDPIDWLPDKAWLTEHHVDYHAAFITETQELHKLYLDRLQAGLDTSTELAPILGVMASELRSLPDACNPIGLKSVAFSALSTVNKFAVTGLNADEKGAVYLYTTNVLYRRLNEALRHPDRSKVKVYFEYLRVFLEAYGNMEAQPQILFRGINKNLAEQYKACTSVTWWTISSCTPNKEVAKAFGGGLSTGTLFHVQTKTAVPIMHLSAYQSEEEYVLAPGTRLKVVKVVNKPNEATQIYLEEMTTKRQVQ